MAPVPNPAGLVIDPIVKLAFALILGAVGLMFLGYDPIGLAGNFIEQTVRSFLPGI